MTVSVMWGAPPSFLPAPQKARPLYLQAPSSTGIASLCQLGGLLLNLADAVDELTLVWEQTCFGYLSP